MIEILEKLFGSAAKVKIMRLFLFNPHETFTLHAIAQRSQVSPAETRHNLVLLEEIGLIKSRKPMGTKKSKRKLTQGWTINEDFTLINQLRELVLYVSPFRNREIVKRLSRVGKLRLVVLSGVFLHNLDARIDLLIVGEGIKKNLIDTVLKKIESELGREIKYAAFEAADFKYRMDMYDKLVRDIFDYPHERILDKLVF